MSNRTSLRMRVLPRFPARITGTNGLTVVQDNLDLVVKPDFGSLVPVPSVENPDTTFFLGWESTLDSYSSISFQNLVENIQSVIIGPTTAAMEATTPTTDQFIYFTGTDVAATTGLTSAGRALLDDADASAQRTTLGLAIGTNVQPYDADLTAIAGLTSAADKGIQFTGAGTAGTFDLTAAGKALLDDANAAAQRTTLGLGGAAVLNVGTTAGTVAAGDDSRIIQALSETTDIAYNVKRASVTMGSTTADTAPFLAMLTAQASKVYFLPPGELWLNQKVPLTSTLSSCRFIGAYKDKTRIVAKAAITALFEIQNGCNSVTFENITFDVSGFSVVAFLSTYVAGQSSGQFRFINCTFVGNTAGDIVRLGLFGDGYSFVNCDWVVQNSAAWGLTLDTGPHNISVKGGVWYGNGGNGLGIRVVQSNPADGTTHRVEGLTVEGTKFILGGSLCCQIGPSLWTTFTNVCFDQFSTTGLELVGNANSGADGVKVVGSYFGSAGINGIVVNPDGCNGLAVMGSEFNNLQYCLNVVATTTKSTIGHVFMGNECRNISKSIVKEDSSAVNIANNEVMFSTVVEGAFHLYYSKIETPKRRAYIGGNKGASTIVLDPGVPLPTGSGNVDGGEWLDYKSVSLGLSSAQSIPNNSVTQILWTAEDYDPMGVHTASAASIVIPAGVSVAEFTVGSLWASNSTGNRVVQLRVGGVTVREIKRTAFFETPDQLTRQFAVTAGQVWDVAVFQDSGGALNFAAGAFFQMRVLG